MRYVRILLALVACLVMVGCSSGGSPESNSVETPSASTSAAQSEARARASYDPCDLLSTTELRSLAGDAVGASTPGLVAGIPSCKWATAGGGFVQTTGSTASDWAKSIPDALRAIEASGQFNDADNLGKIRQGAALIEAGGDLSPARSCALFSEMLELQGKPPGSQWIVTVVPTRTNPQAVTGQMCSEGTFTSVMVAAQAGLEEPLPLEAVARALKVAHRNNIG